MAKKKTTARKTAKKTKQKTSKKTARKTGKKSPAKKAGRKKAGRKKSGTRRVAAAAQAEQIARRGENVRTRIRNTVVGIMRDHKLDLDDLTTVAGEVMRGAAAGVKELDPKNRESTLRKVVDGVGDAFSQTAHATELALRESTRRGRSYAKREVNKTAKNLRELQDRFVDTLTHALKSAGREVSAQAKSVNSHIRNTAKNVRPSVESALRAAGEHPVKFAGETASIAAISEEAGLEHLDLRPPDDKLVAFNRTRLKSWDDLQKSGFREFLAVSEEARRAASAALQYLSQRGAILIIGPPGSGKELLCRDLTRMQASGQLAVEALPRQDVSLSF